MLTRRSLLAGSVALPFVHVAHGGRRAPSDELRFAVVGLNGQGWGHFGNLRQREGARVVALCDVDRNVLERRAAQAAQEDSKGNPGLELTTATDLRELLEGDQIDAVSIATPNHSHTLLACWAMKAGKHVYVEKPMSQNVAEGARLIEVSAATGMLCQVGTQSRSSEAIRDAFAWVRAGNLGKITHAQGLCYKPRKSIGKVEAPVAAPEHVEHDLWCGPREVAPVRRGRYHYDWHWQWDYGNGDLANQGVHQLDQCRWALGDPDMPTSVRSIGGRVGYDDDGETPNTLASVIRGEGVPPIVFEVRGLPKDAASRKEGNWGAHMDLIYGTRVSAIIHCEGGVLVVPNYRSAFALDAAGKEVERWNGASNHHQNFVDAVRAGDASKLNAPPREGHLSAVTCHLSNDSWRVGGEQSQAEALAACESDAFLDDAARRMHEHLGRHGLQEAPLTLGKQLVIDPMSGLPTDRDAMTLARGTYRDGFELPSAT